MTISAPRPIAIDDDINGFDCGVPMLDDWLRRRARSNADSGAARTYVTCEGTQVVAYYALAAGSVATTAAPGRVRRNMPDPIPVVVLGRLAINRSHQRQGLGRELFLDAAMRAVATSEIVGVRALVVDAISPEAREFYLKLGMVPSPLAEMTLMVTIADLKASVRP